MFCKSPEVILCSWPSRNNQSWKTMEFCAAEFSLSGVAEETDIGVTYNVYYIYM